MYKVLVIGDVRVGKTSFVHRFVNNTFKENYKVTLGVDFALKTLELSDGQALKLQLWDIAGHERATSMTRVYYKGASACVLMFDVTDPETFQSCTKWKQDLDAKVFLADQNPIPCLLLANKSDLVNERKVSDQDIKRFVKDADFVGWKLCSVKNNEGLEDGMKFLTTRMLQRCKAITMTAQDTVLSLESDGENRSNSCCRSNQ
ncbi:ras-related protein Rab-7L1-like [Styela clava]|uniref:ras-related protein Rab-7L1-like n=1 Tax=Styela clava TaxID=7725 RepID=UPI00193AAD99|nr:ras-related protein Rab-7L1-like [Styela clava]